MAAFGVSETGADSAVLLKTQRFGRVLTLKVQTARVACVGGFKARASARVTPTLWQWPQPQLLQKGIVFLLCLQNGRFYGHHLVVSPF